MKRPSHTRSRIGAVRTGGDRGSLSMVMLVVIVGLGLSALMVPLIITQNQSTSHSDTRVQALHQAQAGVDAMLGRLRFAASDGGGAKTMLPCYGDGNGALAWSQESPPTGYSVTLQYFTLRSLNGFESAGTPLRACSRPVRRRQQRPATTGLCADHLGRNRQCWRPGESPHTIDRLRIRHSECPNCARYRRCDEYRRPDLAQFEDRPRSMHGPAVPRPPRTFPYSSAFFPASFRCSSTRSDLSLRLPHSTDADAPYRPVRGFAGERQPGDFEGMPKPRRPKLATTSNGRSLQITSSSERRRRQTTLPSA